MSGALYSITPRGAIILTPAIYNADHQNHVDNGDAAHLGGTSADVAGMKITSDPGALGSESLAASIADEIKRLRFVLARIVGGSKQWYEAPSTDLDSAQLGFLFGLTTSNNAGDAANDIDIGVGRASSESAVGGIMILAAGIIKRIDATWAVGTNQGGLDTGAIANTTYHMHLIRRPDTGVVDLLFSLSAIAPTMPANYTQRRRIGSIVRVAGSNLAYKQFGDEFRLTLSVTDVNLTGLGTATANRILASIPAGLELEVGLLIGINDAAAVARNLYLNYPGESDASNGVAIRTTPDGNINFGYCRVRTNTSRQVQTTLTGGGAGGVITLTVRSWFDTRGRLY